MSDYCVQCFGSGWDDGGCVNLCESCGGSGRGLDVDALKADISRLRMVEEAWKLQKHMPAAVIECLDEIEKLEAESESLRKDAERYRKFRALTLNGLDDTPDDFDKEFDMQISSPENH